MWLALVVSVTLLVAESSARAEIRAPSCEALSAFTMGARHDPVEISFGKSPSAMTADEFDQAIDVVQVCIDQIEARSPDVPGLMMRERKRPQLVALRQFVEDLKLYRSDRRERERRAAQKQD
jgi:hypothetical protein